MGKPEITAEDWRQCAMYWHNVCCERQDERAKAMLWELVEAYNEGTPEDVGRAMGRAYGFLVSGHWPKSE